MSTYLSCSYTVCPSCVFVSEYVTVTVDHLSLIFVFLCISIHSLMGNSIGDEGAVAISEAMKTMTKLQGL